MASKRSRTNKRAENTQKTLCGVCCKAVDDEKDDALLCEGQCHQWMHRFCAGVTTEQYERLGLSERPFLCYVCNQDLHRKEVTKLQGEMEALRLELSQLKETVGLLQSSQQSKCPWFPECSKSSNKHQAKNSNRRSRRNCSQSGDVAKSSTSNTAQSKQPPPSIDPPKRKRVPIVGARRIWGTLRTTTHIAVANTLKRFTTVDVENLRVKRKFKLATTDPRRVQKWWFMVRGNEDILQQLEASWDAIAVQTAWKLEPAYTYESKCNETLLQSTHHPAVQHDDPDYNCEIASTVTVTTEGESSTNTHFLEQ